MSSLTAARNTPQLVGGVLAFLIAANTTVQQGSLVVLSSGYAEPGTEATGLIAVGRAEETVSAVAAGDASVLVREGIFRFDNSTGTDVIAQSNVGSDCYIVDDQTVALTSNTNKRSRAGKVVAVDDVGVWVKIGLGV
jgi:hypothetical protein